MDRLLTVCQLLAVLYFVVYKTNAESLTGPKDLDSLIKEIFEIPDEQTKSPTYHVPTPTLPPNPQQPYTSDQYVVTPVPYEQTQPQQPNPYYSPPTTSSISVASQPNVSCCIMSLFYSYPFELNQFHYVRRKTTTQISN